MGLLSSAQLAALDSGAKIAHKVEIINVGWQYVAPGYEFTTSHTIHDETAGTPICVESFGSRANSVGNISPKSFGDVNSMRCEFVIDNSDGKALREAIDEDGMFHARDITDNSYMSRPYVCRVKHSKYAWVAGDWSELPGSPWTGQIVDVIYDDDNETATIQAEAYVANVLREPWDVAHSHTTIVSMPYTPNGLYIGSISSGVTSGGNTWAQFNASEAVSADGATGYQLYFTYRGVQVTANTYTLFEGNSTTSPFTIQEEDTSPPAEWRWCMFSVVLTADDDDRIQTFRSPLIPMINSGDDPTARPW